MAIKFPNLVNHYIYSATGSHPGLKGYFGGLIAYKLRTFWQRDKIKISPIFSNGRLQQKNKKPQNQKDWVSRDNNVVDNYVNDPFCMQIFKNQFFVDLLME